MIKAIGIGDVLAVNTGDALAAQLIRVGEYLAGRPGHVNHVVVVHHQDARGTWWGIEGRPGGVGYVDMTAYLTGSWAKYANSNGAQPRTDEQRAEVAKVAEGLLGVGYDWIGGITCDALDCVHCTAVAKLVDDWWGWTDPKNSTMRPAHVVCSSMAAWIHEHLGLAHPDTGEEERCMPADWWAFNRALPDPTA